MFTALAIVSALGIVALSGGETTKQQKSTVKKYSVEYCKQNLNQNVFDSWNCQDIAYQLQDNWLKDDLEYLLRNGYTFQRAVEEFVEKGKIKLQKKVEKVSTFFHEFEYIFGICTYNINVISNQKKELANMLLILVGLGLGSAAAVLMANEEF